MEPKEKQQTPAQNGQIQAKQSKSWFRRKKEILLGAALAFGAAAICISSAGEESSMLYLYKQGKVGIEQLSVDDKMSAWISRIATGSNCGDKFAEVMDELNEEYFRLMKAGDEANLRKISELREALIRNQLSRIEQFPECKKKNR